MTKVSRKPVYPALDNSKPVQNPDLLNIADKNYTSTIMRYSNLAILYSQLDTENKTIVGAINELANKPTPQPVQSKIINILANEWTNYYGQNIWSASKFITDEIDLHNYNVLVQPAETIDYVNEPFWYSYNISADVDHSGHYLSFGTSIGKPMYDMTMLVTYYACKEGYGLVTSTAFSGRFGIKTVTIPVNAWNRTTHIAPIILQDQFEETGLSPVSQQVIMPLLPTSQANIENNLALQEANLQDAGQDFGWIQLFAENIPSRDLQVRIMFNG